LSALTPAIALDIGTSNNATAHAIRTFFTMSFTVLSLRSSVFQLKTRMGTIVPKAILRQVLSSRGDEASGPCRSRSGSHDQTTPIAARNDATGACGRERSGYPVYRQHRERAAESHVWSVTGHRVGVWNEDVGVIAEGEALTGELADPRTSLPPLFESRKGEHLRAKIRRCAERDCVIGRIH
jgi:hypothetical protein